MEKKVSSEHKHSAGSPSVISQIRSWLPTILLVIVLAVGIILARRGALPQHVLAGGVVMALLFGIVISTLGSAWTALSRNKWLLFPLGALWLCAIGYPVVHRIWPGKELASGRILQAEQPVALHVENSKGPFDLWVQAELNDNNGNRPVEYNYELQLHGDKHSDTITGTFDSQMQQTRSRRGATSSWLDRHTEAIHAVKAKGKDLTITVDQLQDVKGGLSVKLYRQYIPFWVVLIGIGVVLLLALIIEAAFAKPHQTIYLLPAVLLTGIFMWRFYAIATPSQIINPALDAGLLCLFVGALPGLLIGWLIRRARKMKEKRNET